MARKTVGHVELEWTCKRCGTKNPGLQKTCLSCGAIMEAQDRFELPEQSELISDPAVIAEAERGEDIHCPYCGARNPAGTANCIQCNGSLAEGAGRESGQVLGDFKQGPAPDVICPACGTANPASAPSCTNCGGSLAKEPAGTIPAAATASRSWAKSKLSWFGVVAGILLVLGVITLISLASRKQDIQAVVSGAHWERSIEVMEERLVDHSGWQEQIPSGAITVGCEDRVRTTQSDPAPGAEEVCGAPYTIDEGNGMGKVVQDCEYRIHDDWCEYKMNEWQVVETHRSRGSDLNPDWPVYALFVGQQEGDRNEDYTVTFQAENEHTYSYSPSDAVQFSQFTTGSSWMLKVNGLGSVVDVMKR